MQPVVTATPLSMVFFVPGDTGSGFLAGQDPEGPDRANAASGPARPPAKTRTVATDTASEPVRTRMRIYPSARATANPGKRFQPAHPSGRRDFPIIPIAKI